MRTYLATTNPSLHGHSPNLQKSKINSYDFPDFFVLSSIIPYCSFPCTFCLFLCCQNFNISCPHLPLHLLSSLISSPHLTSLLLSPLFYSLLTPTLTSLLLSPLLNSSLSYALHSFTISSLQRSPLFNIILCRPQLHTHPTHLIT